MGHRIRVATVITRLAAGAGGVALRGALALDPERFAVTVVTGAAALFPGRSARPGVLAGDAALAVAEPGDLLARAAAAGLAVRRIPALLPQPAPAADALAIAALARLLADFDVVHTHCAKAGALGRAAAYRRGVPRIVHTLHGLPWHDDQPAWRRLAYRRIERRLAGRTDAFLAVGAAVRAAAIRHGLAAPGAIRTIWPVVDPDPAPADRAAARRRLGLPAGVPVVGTVGRIDTQKAPLDWVDGLAASGPSIWGVWVGDGPLRAALRDRVARRGLTDRVRLVGHRDDVPALLPAFDVFTLASRYEGMPCVLVEAMRAGVPVVATAVDAVPELVVPEVTGLLVPPGRPELLGRAARRLLAEPDTA
ncbi:glycosyltransferase, partial [Actinocatenispora thailandica]|uniref:glycosyltransferase n=1 Tax=Actinocatenispora thailandica TaxID=227318 RepID=UPI0031D74299